MGGIPLEVVAAITAAVAAVLETSPDRLVFRAIAAEPGAAPPPGPSPWSAAGRLEQHLTRGQMALRPR